MTTMMMMFPSDPASLNIKIFGKFEELLKQHLSAPYPMVYPGNSYKNPMGSTTVNTGAQW